MITNLETKSYAMIDRAIAEHNLSGFFAMFSGGYDSLVNTHLASRHPAFRGVIHIDTGTGIRETKRYVIETCERYGWTLYICQPHIRFEAVIMIMGLPGRSAHGLVYAYLKNEPLRRLLQDIRKDDGGSRGWRIGLTSGVRKQESERRMLEAKFHDVFHEPKTTRVWIPHIVNFTSYDVKDYIATHDLPRNPVKDRLHISGECLCGCFGSDGEKKEIEMWYPEAGARLNRYEELARIAHQLHPDEIPADRQQWAWSNGRVSDDQMELFPLCHYCRAARAE